jgi:two-component sensor histidine kinase
MNDFSRLLKMGTLVLFILLSSFPTIGKTALPVVDPQTDYEKAIVLIEAFQLDSAKILLEQAIKELEQSKELHTTLGIQIRLKRAEALEKNDEDEAAISQLLEVASDSKQQEYWGAFANAQLSLARLHEKHDRPRYCYKALQQAQVAIKYQNLDYLFPRFATRMSSYHRIFGREETALFYAKEVIRTASELDQQEYLGNGHMLTAMLLRENDYKTSAVHFLKAAEIFKSLNNQTGYTAMLCNLSSLYQNHQQPELALEYSDAYLQAFDSGEGVKDAWTLSKCYEVRSEILIQLDQPDLAYHYLQLAFKNRLKLIEQENRTKVVEIEARFNGQQQAQMIEEQAQLLEYEAIKWKWGIGIGTLSLLFTGLLIFFYLKLRAVNKKMRKQAVLINEKNLELGKNLEQQIMLQGEIHHRVKNNLQVIISLLELQQEDIQDPKTLNRLESMSNRIYSMAAVHDMLYSEKGAETISFPDYTRNLCEHFRHIAPEDQTPVFHLDMNAHPLNLETLMPLGIVMSELMTNSLKYATIPGHPLEINIHLQPCADGYCLTYQDNGPGFPNGTLSERKGGLGSYLVKSMVRQLSGQVKTNNHNGAVYQIFFKEKNQSQPQHELISDSYRGR